jgi:hypothetical protein
MGKQNEFELVFRDFVSGFGGEVLTETYDSKIADYVFRTHNVVAELKCLMEDQTNAMNQKVAQAVRHWWRNGGKIPEGYDSSKPLEIATAPKEIAERWVEILKAPIENVIRDANRQIRETKARLSLADARGLVLVFNHGNFLHNNPNDFRVLTGSVLRKRDKEKERRFPHIHGLVYFSYDSVKSVKENMNFWAAMQLKTAPDDDVTQMRDLQKELQQAWYAFVEKKWGKKVRQFSRE